MPVRASFHPTPSQMSHLAHAVDVGKAHSGGAVQGSWDVPSAHAIDRTSVQASMPDQFEAAAAIQRVARGHNTREVMSYPAQGNIYEIADYMRASRSPQKGPAGQATNSFELRDRYAWPPKGNGYNFVNSRYDQFGSTDGFNESTTSKLADPKPTAQMRVKSGYTGHVPKGRDHIGSTYRTHDNRGSAGKTMVPIPNRNTDPPNDEYLAKMKRNMTYLAGQSAVFVGRMDAHSEVDGARSFVDSHAGKSTVKIPERIEKLMEHEDMKGPDGTIATAEIGDLHDDKYIKGAGKDKNPMAGYTGHVRDAEPARSRHSALAPPSCCVPLQAARLRVFAPPPRPPRPPTGGGGGEHQESRK